ncbi:hypothetical protein KAS79_00840 [Candidatus Parcubacteria bacterium]|nr:hypothetical protein [Candidatus Parcubacteria bacterium]
MKMTKWIMGVFLIIVLVCLSGCVDEEKTAAKTINYGSTNLTETRGPHKSLIGLELDTYRITGKIIDIDYIITREYLITFEGDITVPICSIEGYNLEKGKFYRMEIIKHGGIKGRCRKIMKLEEI